ncbi:TrbI/VirB10 family protein [Algimonas porphyrae]|uniref:Conjugal transfer protein TrbI n=1 Tax=Algimonas porphyrae TaxID=1128113 RepID=A0ABQ5V2K4_9PROT|nr:TrbI/VirB10 family protein [Algimonas porphyrae]GLQ21312.1 conjugal transfer protein TrbI [Algimonas porphyrae]
MSDTLELRGKPKSVRRFSRQALIGLITITSLILVGATAMALRSPERDNQAAPQELYNTTMKALPDGLSAMPTSYSDIERITPILGPPLPGDLGAGMVGRERAPVPQDNPFRYQPGSRSYPSRHTPNAHPSADEILSESARTSDLFFISHDGQSDLRSGQDRYAQVRSFSDQTRAGTDAPIVFDAGSDGLKTATDDLNPQTRKEAFLGAEIDAEIYNPHRIQSPVSPFQVMAGTIIPASLITGLKSDLPGQVIAQVTEHVYDTPTGQHLLIPQGSKLIGRYDSVIAYGQSRALVVWSRIIMPDGTSVTIENLPAVDMAGYAGLEDSVDRHGWRLFKAAILSSILSVSSEIGRDRDDDILNAMRDGGQQTINQAGQQIVTQQLQVQPTLKIRPGWRLRIIVNKDIVLQPYGGAP